MGVDLDGMDPRCTTQEREALKRLVERVEQIVPYVTATLGPGNRFKSERRPEWVEIHGGRCFSSHNQLEILLKEAQDMKKELGLDDY